MATPSDEILAQSVARRVDAVKAQTDKLRRQLLKIESDARAAGIHIEPVAPMLAAMLRKAGVLPQKPRPADPRQLELWPEMRVVSGAILEV